MELSLRPAEPADREFARTAHHSAYRDVVEHQFGTWDEQQQDAFFDQDWDSANFDMITADGATIGYCAIEERADDIHLRELVIDPSAQGRGIASILLERLQDRARRLHKPIRLGTFPKNRALGLYSRLGFVPIGSTETHVLMEWRADP